MIEVFTERIRVGNSRNAGEKPRPIIIKLVRYNDWKKIFDSKKTYAMKRKEKCNHRMFDCYVYQKVEWGEGEV